MEKIISIGDKEVRLSNNVAWLMEYKDQFGQDPVQEIVPLVASIAEGMAAVMSEAGDDGGLDLQAALSGIEGRALDVLLPLCQSELSTLMINTVWAMAKAADENVEPPKRWVRQFDSFPLDIIVPEVWELISKGFISSKNLQRLSGMIINLKAAQPLRSTTLSSQGSSEA